VREAFWKQPPRLPEVLASLDTPRVFIAPLFISEGYFSERVIPRALGLRTLRPGPFRRSRRQGRQTFYYCKPVGTHERITAAILARAREVVQPTASRRAPPLKQITLFLAGHGTARDPNSRQAIERQAELIRALGLFAAVQALFLEEDPRIGRCWDLAATRHIVMVPFFISDGLHVQEDLPVILGAGAQTVQRRLARGRPAWRNPTQRHGKLLWLSLSVGTHPSLADVVLDRVREAAASGSSL